MFQLNSDQKNILKFVLAGHNILVTGQAGAGKSEVVRESIKRLNEVRKNVAVVCSSGIACQVYERGVASTVHSYYGFQAANNPWKQIVSRSAENSLVHDRLKSMDVLIWDEASMSSQRMFELANALQHTVAEDEPSHHRFFAGKQIVLVGEFLQLKPVPNTFDYGNFMFSSPLFVKVIPHRFKLTEIMCQTDHAFLSAILELRLGKCSVAMQEYLSGLGRPLPSALENDATHIFFRKGNAMLFNRLKINKLSGKFVSFSAIFENVSHNVSWPGYRVLQLKKECKVMLLWNKSDSLIKDVRNDALLVSFEGVVEVKRETWIKHNHAGIAMGSVSQFPLIPPAYAVTSSKV
jgi:hypothetical protein